MSIDFGIISLMGVRYFFKWLYITFIVPGLTLGDENHLHSLFTLTGQNTLMIPRERWIRRYKNSSIQKVTRTVLPFTLSSLYMFLSRIKRSTRICVGSIGVPTLFYYYFSPFWVLESVLRAFSGMASIFPSFVCCDCVFFSNATRGITTRTPNPLPPKKDNG